MNDHLRSDPSVPALPPVSFDQKGRGLVAPVKLVAVPSPDGGALSVLFEGLTADTQRVHDEGGRVVAWTVNQTTVAERLIRWGIDGICSDVPGVMRRLADQLPQR